MIRRQERVNRREERRDGPSGSNRYKMREKLVAIGDDFYIEDQDGRRAFKVDGKALRVRNTLEFQDLSGNTLYSIQERMARVRDTMEIERDGRRAAIVKKAVITPLRERFTIDGPGGQMDAQGNILDHEYTISRGGDRVAEISKKWFRLRDTYGVEVNQGEDDALILAIATVIDQMGSAR